MDERLVTWGRAVKSRFRAQGRSPVPPLWLFTDPNRMDVVQAVAALPPGLCGVVFRHDGVPGRRQLLHAVARLCRARRTMLVVAGNGARNAAGAGGLAGRHLRGGRPVPGLVPGSVLGPGAPSRCATASAHGVADMVRARRAGAACCFLSPLFPTASHPGAPALGLARWCAMARQSPLPALALGGMDGTTARRLPRWVRGIGAISALLP